MIQPGASQWIGKPYRRIEDQRLLQGRGRYTDDVVLPGQLHAAFVRSPHAHAKVSRLDVAAAKAAPGVVAVYTGEDLIQAGLDPVPFTALHKRPDGSPMQAPPRRALSAGEVRFVGDAVAMVVAATRDEARDAAELVEVDWEPLEAVTDLRAAAADPANIAAFYRKGDAAACEAAFAAAAHVTRVALWNQRIIANPLEPRSLVGAYEGDRFVLHCPTQNSHTVRFQMAKVFKLPEDRFRILVEDLGGGFGTRGYGYPEHAAVLFAARELGRPVKWRADRSENFLTEVHGRGSYVEGELALDAAGRFTAIRIRALANVGGYASNFGAVVPALSGARAPTGVYAIPAARHEVTMLWTHTTPVDAYRGAGRPEMGYLIERMVTLAARELGKDPVALRAQNMVSPAQMPYQTAIGLAYDCGNFEGVMRAALADSDPAGYPARKAAAERRGRLYGRGFAAYVETSGSARLSEAVEVTVHADGSATLVSGTQQIGQGIQTAYAQIVGEVLGIEPDRITVIQGDTDVAKTGGGAGGSRALQVGGTAAMAGARALVEAGKALAAQELEAAAVDLEFTGGRYRIAGTDRSIGLPELAARQPEKRLQASLAQSVSDQTWPNGCQVCEVEIDPDTGVIQVASLVGVDDIGRVINPLVAEGQIHGGMAQGLGQALMEQSVYDEGGQLLTGSFMDYAMPRADGMPELRLRFDESQPTALNLLGAKGAGEAGCHGAMPALLNAVLDALAPFGVKALDMPLTPEKVWRAIRR